MAKNDLFFAEMGEVRTILIVARAKISRNDSTIFVPGGINFVRDHRIFVPHGIIFVCDQRILVPHAITFVCDARILVPRARISVRDGRIVKNHKQISKDPLGVTATVVKIFSMSDIYDDFL